MRFHCDVHFDPFLFMQENNKIYGLSLLHFSLSNFHFPFMGHFRVHDLVIRVPAHDPDALVRRRRYAHPPFVFLTALNRIGTADFVAEHPEFVSPNSAMNFLSDDGGDSYNNCHCASLAIPPSLVFTLLPPVWSNFEIGDLDFWRGPAYTAFFDYLESRGGFYYEVPPLPSLIIYFPL